MYARNMRHERKWEIVVVYVTLYLLVTGNIKVKCGITAGW
jgi:hypothetical protein